MSEEHGSVDSTTIRISAEEREGYVPGADRPANEPVVIEDGIGNRRVRRPLDLARFTISIAIIAAIVLGAYVASGTTTGIGNDFSAAIESLPSLLRLAINVVSGVGTIALPVTLAIYLLARRRIRLLLDSLIGLLLSYVLLALAGTLIKTYGTTQLIAALAGSADVSTSSTTAPLLGALITFVTVARAMSRRPWNVLSVAVIVSVLIVTILNGSTTIAAVAMSAAFGWGLGLLLRYVLGTPTTRPSGIEVARALDRGGFPVTSLQSSTLTRIGRRYNAITRSGQQVEVVVLDRDLEGAGLVSALWRSLRLRDEPGTGAFSMRKELDHAALTNYAAQAAGAPVPRLLLASEVGPDSALLCFERIEGRRFSDVQQSLTDDDLEAAWRAMRTLHENQVSHRALTAENLLLDGAGAVWLIGESAGSVAASDVAQRIDVADLLVTLALLTDADRAIRTGRRVLGVSGLSRALPVLQPVALSPSNRRAIRKDKRLLVRLRDALVEIRPDGAPEQIEIRRVNPRTLLMVVLGSVAGYFLLSQLADVDLVRLISTASWQWFAIAMLASLVTYIGAAWSLSGFVPEKLSTWRTMLAQLAGDFATLVSPPTLGAVAINVRFLQKSGLHPALAAASVGVSQVAAFVTHILLLLAFGIAAGTQSNETFDPPQWAVVAAIAVVVIVLGLLLVPVVRRFALGRIRPMMREVVPRLVTVVQRPLKLIEGIGGILLLNAAYIVVLMASVKAFGGDLSIAAVAVVYLAGATLGQAAPTPGGLGAVEAALASGLTLAGLDSGIAVSAVLLYRLVTFWIPTVPGYLSFNWLQKVGNL